MSHSLQCGRPITAPNFPPSAYSRIDKLLHGDPYYSYKKEIAQFVNDLKPTDINLRSINHD